MMIIVKTKEHEYQLRDTDMKKTKKFFGYDNDYVKNNIEAFCIAVVGFVYGMAAYFDADDNFGELTIIKAND